MYNQVIIKQAVYNPILIRFLLLSIDKIKNKRCFSKKRILPDGPTIEDFIQFSLEKSKKFIII